MQVKEEQVDDQKKAWNKHGSQFEADAYEEDEEETEEQPPERTSASQGLGQGPGPNEL